MHHRLRIAHERQRLVPWKQRPAPDRCPIKWLSRDGCRSTADRVVAGTANEGARYMADSLRDPYAAQFKPEAGKRLRIRYSSSSDSWSLLQSCPDSVGAPAGSVRTLRSGPASTVTCSGNGTVAGRRASSRVARAKRRRRAWSSLDVSSGSGEGRFRLFIAGSSECG